MRVPKLCLVWTSAVGLAVGCGVERSMAASALPASFDCAKALTVTEGAICGNSELSDLDGQVGQAFSDAIAVATPAQMSNLRSDEKDWIKKRNEDCRANPICLLASFHQRLEALSSFKADRKSKLTAQTRSDASAEQNIPQHPHVVGSGELPKPSIDHVVMKQDNSGRSEGIGSYPAPERFVSRWNQTIADPTFSIKAFDLSGGHTAIAQFKDHGEEKFNFFVNPQSNSPMITYTRIEKDLLDPTAPAKRVDEYSVFVGADDPKFPEICYWLIRVGDLSIADTAAKAMMKSAASGMHEDSLGNPYASHDGSSISGNLKFSIGTLQHGYISCQIVPTSVN